MSTIFFVIDNFCPRPYYDTTQINNDSFYIVINTFLVADLPECQPLEQYMNPVVNSNTVYTWQYLASRQDVLNIIAQENKRLIPVPPPVTSHYSFAFNASNINNGTGFTYQKDEDKIDWLIKSNSFLLLDLVNPNKQLNYFNYINFEQLQTLNAGLIATLTQLLRKTEPLTDPTEIEIAACNWTGEPDTDVFKKNFADKILNQQNAIPEANRSTFPLGIDQFYLAKYCRLLRPKDLSHKSALVPEVLKFSMAALLKLRENEADIVLELGPEMNYRKILYNNIFEEYNSVLIESGKDEALANLSKRLQFFYGSGERLRVKKELRPASIMVIKDTDTPTGQETANGETWIETNAYSLFGQVAEIPLTEATKPSFINSLQLIHDAENLLAIMDLPAKATYLQSISSYLHNIANNDFNKFNRNVSFLSKYDNYQTGVHDIIQEKCRYYPVNALLKDNHYSIAIDAANNFKTCIKIPESILDHLIETPRVSYDDSAQNRGANFISLHPQRQLLQKEDVFKDEATGGIKHIPIAETEGSTPSISPEDFIPAIILSVQVKKNVLPQITQLTYKISRKAPVPLTPENETNPELAGIIQEIKAFRDLLYQKNGDKDILRTAEFIFKISKQKESATDRLIIPLNDARADGKVDDDELLEIYSDGLEALFNGEPQTKDTIDTDIIILPAGSKNRIFEKGFNILLHPDENKAVLLALDHHYQFRFNVSVNGFSNALGINLSAPSFTASPDNPNGIDNEPLLVDFSNFNKLRVSVNNGSELKLNATDALLPVSEHAEQQPFAMQYKVTHRFSEEVNNEMSDTNQENRFQLYKHAGEPYTLKAKIENQYAYRMNIFAGDVHLPYSNIIRNIAELALNVTNDKDVTSTISFLSYSLTTNGNLKLTLNRDYLKNILDDKNCKPKDGKNISVYRDLYECFFDMQRTQCGLMLELWNFDNSVNTIAPGDAAHPELSNQWPAILANLLLVSRDGVNIDTPQLLNGFDLSSFTAFSNAIKTYKDGGMEIGQEINLSQSLKDKIDNANLLRVGLLSERNPDTTINMQFPAGPVADDTRPFPIPALKEMETDPNLSFLRPANAVTALQNYTEKISGRNRLYRSFGYINSEWYAGSLDGPVRKNVKEILGETISMIWKPNKVAPNKTDMLLYYIPYSFKPLRVHPALTDLKTTIDFTEYLLRVLNWLAYPEKQKEDPDTFLINIEQTNDKDLLFDSKIAARKLLSESGIALSLANLVTHVDNRTVAPTDSHYLQVLRSTEKIQEDLGKVFESLLINEPLKYITAKGFGLGLFSNYKTSHLAGLNNLPEDGVLSDLYAFQLIKDIRKASAVVTTDLTSNDHDLTTVTFKSMIETSGNRYFVEPLEDALFDNEFQITEGDGFSLSFPGTKHALEARTGEDLLENIQLFDEQVQGKAKLQVAHFCPDWTFNKDKYYLLPSRKPPSTPVPYKSTVFQLLKNSSDQEEWEKLISATKEDIEVDFGSKTGKAKFKSTGNVATSKDTDDLRKNIYQKRWDIFVNIYDFIIEPDEEGEIGNDLFEIMIEDQNKTTDAKRQPNLDPTDLTDIPTEGLFKQYQYYVRKDEVLKPDAIPLTTLLSPNGQPAGRLEILLKELIQANTVTEGLTANYTLHQSTSDEKTFILQHTTDGSVVNRIFSAEVFRCFSQSGVTIKYLIRLKVLADPWVHYHLRLRVRRNMRDIGMDGKFDINPVFIINSDFSPWIDYGIQKLSYNYLLNPDASSALPPELKYLEPDNMTIAQYLKLLDSETESFNFGEVILKHIKQYQILFDLNEVTKDNRGISAYIEENVRSAAPQLFHREKTLPEIIKYIKATTDAFTKGGIDYTLYKDIGTFNVPFKSMRSYEPVIHFSWRHEHQVEKEIFSIAWKLKLKSDIEAKLLEKILSGATWVTKFPDRKNLQDLVSPFKENTIKFIDAMITATANVTINSVLRPRERAYLMHWSFRIANNHESAQNVPAMAGVDIEWWHRNQPDSETAAADMVEGYGIVRLPALTSNHTKGLAVDMNINDFLSKKIKKADGTMLTTNTFDDLIKVGESFNVFHKVPDDKPHWSADGH